MAGRPKTMAKKVTELKTKAEEVFSLIDEYIPEQYEMHEGPLEKTDLLCQTWNEALFAAQDAMLRMADLAVLLRDKAGIPKSESHLAFLKELAKRNESHQARQGRESVGAG